MSDKHRERAEKLSKEIGCIVSLDGEDEKKIAEFLAAALAEAEREGAANAVLRVEQWMKARRNELKVKP